MSNEKGGLIRKKKKSIMQPPAPVKKTQETDFAYSESTKVVQQPIVTEKVTKELPKPNLSVGKKNSTKSIKVPTIIHTEINLLGSFMDENKTYSILQNLIDSYVKNELTDRQQRQFGFMVEAFSNKEK
ncbi:hypothetical protein [Viridibacillus arvi]|uniref:hypothetical protein n=1 Tax=Viridibacillus arvi TaxID=263475 RepID=UPI003D01A39D